MSQRSVASCTARPIGSPRSGSSPRGRAGQQTRIRRDRPQRSEKQPKAVPVSPRGLPGSRYLPSPTGSLRHRRVCGLARRLAGCNEMVPGPRPFLGV